MSLVSEAKGVLAGDNSVAAFDVERIREDFPILKREVYGRPLVYLDNAASAQKPRQVIQAMTDCMENHYSNVHRGVHRLSQEATDLYEGGRKKLAGFINAASDDEIVFTRGATEAINLVASSFGSQLEPGDEVIFTEMEHHSNIVPWHLLRDRAGITLKAVPITPEGELDMAAFDKLLTPKTKLVAVVHISNALGTINPIKEITEKAHAVGAKVLVDGCQALPHMAVDVRDLDVDFYAFSGHKMYGPTGIGALYGKKALLDSLPPYQGGGEMIASVTLEKSTFKKAPHRFEAGTPAIVEAVGIGAAVDYLQAVGLENVAAHEAGLLAYATQKLEAIEGLTLHGRAREKAGILSFTLDCAHPHDIGTIVDRTGVAVRAGHHCAQPVMDAFGVAATARASVGLYNTKAEIDALVEAIETVREFFG